jgi:hypothetical protein
MSGALLDDFLLRKSKFREELTRHHLPGSRQTVALPENTACKILSRQARNLACFCCNPIETVRGRVVTPILICFPKQGVAARGHQLEIPAGVAAAGSPPGSGS